VTKKTRTKTKSKKVTVSNKSADKKITNKTATLTFADNHLAQELFGFHHAHLAQIEGLVGVVIGARGGQIEINGNAADVELAERVMINLYDKLLQGSEIGPDEVSGAVRLAASPKGIAVGTLEVKTKKRSISPRTITQGQYLKAIDENELVFAIGPAGTGKTYLAVAKAVERLIRGEVDRIILSRPAVEAGEQLGFLPGDMREKVDPYLRPLYDALYDMLPAEQVVKRLENGEIEVAPLAFMRGRTLGNAFVILDEAQNTSAVQMKMFLTRLGENARMVVTGDLTQVDLPKGQRSGLRDASEILDDVKGVSFLHFSAADVVRHPLVTRIVNAYDGAEKKRRAAAPYENSKSPKATKKQK